MSRQRQLHAVFREWAGKLLAGETLDQSAIARQYPELLPDLVNWLIELDQRIRVPQPPVATMGWSPVQGDWTGACLSGSELIRYLSGEISDEVREAIEDHLHECQYCFAEYQDHLAFEQMILESHSRRPPDLPCISLPNHEFVRFLHRGGQGAVWLARNIPLDQPRAVKIVSRLGLSNADCQRFRLELSAMSRLGKHPHRVLLYDHVADEHHLALIMEYVPGGSLQDHLEVGQPLEWRRAIHLAIDVALGLIDVQAQGWLHRDIKPANVLIDQSGRAVLGDFGMTTYLQAAFGVVGTSGFAAPELLHSVATTKADVFSLAATLYCAVVGQPPFETNDIMLSLQQAAAGLQRPVAPLAALPPHVQQLILQGLEPDPQDRPELGQFLAELRAAELKQLAVGLATIRRRSVRIDVSLSRRAPGTDEFLRLAAQPDWADLTADGTRPAIEPLRFVARTGDTLILSMSADADGCFYVLGLGTAGTFSLLYPRQAADNLARAQESIDIAVLLASPSGTDRFVLVWSRTSWDKSVEQWREWLGEKARQPGVEPLQVRSIDFVAQTSSIPADEDWTLRLVAVNHDEKANSTEPPAPAQSVRVRSLIISDTATHEAGSTITEASTGADRNNCTTGPRWTLSRPPIFVPGRRDWIEFDISHTRYQPGELPVAGIGHLGLQRFDIHLSATELAAGTMFRSTDQLGGNGRIRYSIELPSDCRLPDSVLQCRALLTLARERVPIAGAKFRLAVSQDASRYAIYKRRVSTEVWDVFRSVTVLSLLRDVGEAKRIAAEYERLSIAARCLVVPEEIGREFEFLRQWTADRPSMGDASFVLLSPAWGESSILWARWLGLGRLEAASLGTPFHLLPVLTTTCTNETFRQLVAGWGGDLPRFFGDC